MKILIVTNTYPPADISGVGALVYELARRLDSEPGHEVKVLTRTMDTSDRWVARAGRSKLFFPLLAAWRGVHLCWKHRFDLVHVHESDGALLCLLLRLARWLRLPVGWPRLVATLQVSYFEERRSVRPIFDGDENVSVPTDEEKTFRRFRAPILAFLGRLTARMSHAVVAPSEQTKRELERDYHARIAAVIYNGVEVPGSLPERQPAADERGPAVLYAGRLRTRKAVAVLVKAFAQVAERHSKARLVIAGDGPQRSALEDQAKALELGSWVEFLGPVHPAEMPRHFTETDIFCLPSIYEGMPLAILEAMAHGLPVVTTTVSGNPEAVDDGESGLLVPPEDATALADALLLLLDDSEKRQAMGRASRRRAERLFTIDTIAGQYIELWQRLLETR